MATRAKSSSQEKAVLESLSKDRLMKHTEQIARWVRLSGSPEEAQAFAYIRGVLEEIGARIESYAVESYVSLPGEAHLEIVSPVRETIECITHAMAAPTPEGGLEGELVYAGSGMGEDGPPVRGRIALLDGIAMPVKVKRTEDRDALGQVHICGEQMHEMIVSVVWGTPTPETFGLLPKTPVVSIRQAGGERLRGLLERGPVRVRLRTQVQTGWREIPCLVGNIPGAVEGERYVLFSGHVDSWHHGAMDNGSANATMLEVVRALANRRIKLRRGIRVAFWSGHSHARYAASAWYCDHCWQDLYDHCVAHVNVDSTGGKGATVLTEAIAMAEVRGLAGQAIGQVTGQAYEGKRPGRAGDQSFWGVGAPAMFMDLSEQPPSDSISSQAFSLLSGQRSKGGGLGWWWHTPEDTLDKIDPDNLLRDTKVYALVLLRLCTEPILPFDYRRTADEIRGILNDYQAKAGEAFDLGPSLREAEALRADLDRLAEAIEKQRRRRGRRPTRDPIQIINACQMRLGRILIPLNYSRVGRFGHDLAQPVPPLPGLEPAARLAAMDRASTEFRLLRSTLVREQNKVVFGLREARKAIGEALGAR
jgi:hypothetical protein